MYTSFYTDAKEVPKAEGNSKYNKIRYMIIDVDGTLTDGGIYYDENGNELKKFNTKDAAGFFTAKASGIFLMVITGRKCKATERRMKELQVDLLAQEVVDKVSFIKEYLIEHNIKKSELAYIGDDLNDYTAMQLAGFRACPSDSAEEIKQIVDYISPYKGGEGAVRDIICQLLKKRNQWESAYKSCYHID